MSDEEDMKEAEAMKSMKSLIQCFPSTDRNADIRATLEGLTDQIEAGDSLYPFLKEKLEGSGLDARHIKKILHLSASTAKRINSTAKNFDLIGKVRRLKRLHKQELANHIAVEYGAGDIRYAPTFEFFYGAICQEGLIVKERKKRARVDLSQNAVTQTKATERDIRTDCEQDSTPKEVEAIFEKVKEKTAEKPNEADFLSAVVDKESFAKTVENLFHFSFLVREGRVGLEKGRSRKPVMKTFKDTQPKQWNQSILSFSMADYKKWVNEQPE